MMMQDFSAVFAQRFASQKQRGINETMTNVMYSEINKLHRVNEMVELYGLILQRGSISNRLGMVDVRSMTYSLPPASP